MSGVVSAVAVTTLVQDTDNRVVDGSGITVSECIKCQSYGEKYSYSKL